MPAKMLGREEAGLAEAAKDMHHPVSDEEIERAIVGSLDDLDREGKVSVLEFARSLGKSEEDEESEEENEHPYAGAIKLLDKWMADESGYDEETWPELKKALDRDRLGYRKLFE